MTTHIPRVPEGPLMPSQKKKVKPKCECRVCEKTVCPDDVICWSCAMKMKEADE